MYQSRDTWYEFLLQQFNPDDLDYGSWMQQRRQAFLDASVRNPYFKYSAGMTLALLVMAMLYAKLWMDHRRSMWITAEMMTDLYNHDAILAGVAREGDPEIQRHIERCNRAIESAEQGTAVPAADSEYRGSSIPSYDVSARSEIAMRRRETKSTSGTGYEFEDPGTNVSAFGWHMREARR